MKSLRVVTFVCALGAAVFALFTVVEAQQPQPQQRRQVGTRPADVQPTIPQSDQRSFGRTRRQVITTPQRVRLRPQPRWRLGVYTDDAPKGLLITRTSRHSPAWYAGLEEGDYLLDVMGYPVGFDRGFYFRLGDALNNYADPDGWVNLGIWNKRTKAEEAMWVQLQSRTYGSSAP